MAVRFDAGADKLSIAQANIVTNGATFTMCAWLKRKTSTATFKTGLYAIVNSDSGECWLEIDSGGSILNGFEDPAPESTMVGPTMTIDTWYFAAYVRTSNTSRAILYGTEAGGTLTKVTNTDSRTFSTDLDEFWIGNDIYTENFDGEIVWVRLWSTNLSDAELDAEWRSTTPVKTGATLRGDWRLTTAATATTDSSGNSLTLTAGGALTDGGANPTPPASSTDKLEWFPRLTARQGPRTINVGY